MVFYVHYCFTYIIMKLKFKYFTNVNFPNRYILPEKLFSFLEDNFSDNISPLGKSVLGLPIYLFSVGKGPINVLAWSQMHGNESTASLAMLDFLYSMNENTELVNSIFEKISLDFIFMLNPDGSKRWTRTNALDIDLNRDFLKEESSEIKILKNLSKEKIYHYALNLHDQRTIFTTDGLHPATLSFLSPSFDIGRNINDTRKKSMAVISYIYSNLNKEIYNCIGRYSDEFYPNSTGDNFTIAGIPTILFEGGHSEGDYLRKKTRKYYTIALYDALFAISFLQGDTLDYKKYFDIPENKQSHYDIIYRNINLGSESERIDIAVQYKEIIKYGDTEISFLPIVTEIGDLKHKKAWKEIDATNKKFVANSQFPKLHQEVNFSIE